MRTKIRVIHLLQIILDTILIVDLSKGLKLSWIFTLVITFSSVDNFGSRLKTSDSDFSDGETSKLGTSRQIQAVQARVRQAALNLFYHVIKVR